MKNIATLSLTFILLSIVPFVAYGGTLTGKLECFREYGLENAPFIPVTLYSIVSKKNLQTVFSDPEGIYYFDNVEAGNYILKVWVNGFKEKSINYEIRVPNKEEISIKPILIHSLRFKIPEKGRRFFAGTVIKPSGTYYSIYSIEEERKKEEKEKYSLWIAFSDVYNNLYFSDNKVKLDEDDGTWTTDSIFYYPLGATQINVVMILEEERKKLQKKVSRGSKYPRFKDIPENSYVILASRDIKIVPR